MSQTKPALTLAVEWIAGSRDPVALSPGDDRIVLHLEARRDLLVRSVRFHFVDGFLGEPSPAEGGPQALCLIGECGPVSGGRPALVSGLTRPVARNTVRVRERVPQAGSTREVLDQFSRGVELWKWSAGLIARQVIGGPNNLWHSAVRMEIPAGACLAFAVSSPTRPCRVRVEVGGQ